MMRHDIASKNDQRTAASLAENITTARVARALVIAPGLCSQRFGVGNEEIDR
jgi:hypothetical protein